mgnify:CR=1 FL=1
MYYKIDSQEANYDNNNTEEVSETEIQNIISYFKKLNNDLGITIVMITHEFEIASYASRVIHIYDGHITYDGPIPKNESVLLKSEQKAHKK